MINTTRTTNTTSTTNTVSAQVNELNQANQANQANEGNQRDQRQRTYLRRLKVWLWFALICFVLSFLFLASDWRFLLVSPPRWTQVPDAYPMLMPHEAVLQFFVEIWHGLISRMGDKGLLPEDTARSIIREGFPIATGWRLFAFISLIIALVQAVGLSKSWAALSQEIDQANETRAQMQQSLAQAELTVNNLLLDPAAQEFSEDLQRVSRQIKGAADGL